jgi:hypothetical protein
MASDETLVTAAEIQASSEIDNMSISEIIQERFKKKVKEVKTPQEVASVIIKGPEDANLTQNVDGDKDEQAAYQKKIADIETNRMYLWSDMNKVKKDLWNKLHQVKNAAVAGVTNLAQIMVNSARSMASHVSNRMGFNS